MLNQAQILYNYNNENRPKFNEHIFSRSDEDIIRELKNVILSCQRDKFFTIKVLSFDVMEDYNVIYETLRHYEEGFKNKSRKKENSYDYINLKDSDIKLIKVKYFISIWDKSDTVTVLIAVPRIVDKYYFRISGNIYSSMYQIVDGSTYNNSTSMSKKHSVTSKTIFMPIRIYRNFYNLKTTKGDTIKTVLYTSRIFNKTLPAMKYLFAKFGYYGALEVMNIGCVSITDYDINDDNFYSIDKNGIYVNAPKYVFDNDAVIQSLVYKICRAIQKDTKYSDIFTDNFWIGSLSYEFNNFTVLEKGLSVLDSLEGIYDISTRESLRLPEENKCDVYRLLLWMMREFSALKTRDNLDISTKKIRCAEYIAALYATKISKGIYRIADIGKKATLDTIKKSIVTHPFWLIQSLVKSKLVNYKNMVNDLDSILAAKYTYKGTSGLGEGNNKSIPDIYRTAQTSHVCRVDLDSSSNTDPGMSGMICPLVKTYGSSFSDYQEPNMWETQFVDIMNNYKAISGLKEVVSFKRDILGIADPEREAIVEECEDAIKHLIKPVSFVELNMIKDSVEEEVLDEYSALSDDDTGLTLFEDEDGEEYVQL